jgi:hypothetical protein
MKKNYSTLNEEIIRIKSLFSEDRLYGNMVNDSILTEQRKFLSNLSDAFTVALKTTDTKVLSRFENFMNREIRDIDDVIKHVGEFDDLWRIVSPDLNTVKLKTNLETLKRVIDNGKLKNLSKEILLKNVLPGFPERGGMRDMVYDFWLEANGQTINLPQKVEKRIVKTSPDTGELVIGTVNEKGVVTYKDKNGKVAFIETQPKQDFGTEKPKDADTKSKDFEPDIEDVDWVEVTKGTPLDDLNGRSVAATEENVRNVIDVVGDKVVGAVDDGKKVVFTITGEGEEGIKAAKEMLDSLTQNKGGTSTGKEVINDMSSEVVKQTGRNFEVVANEIKNKLKNLTWGTRFWWNPLTIGEKTLSEKWGKNLSWRSDANRFLNTRYGKVLIRFIIIGTTYEVGKTIKDPNRDFWESGKNNLFINSWDDLTSLIGSVRKLISGTAIKDMVEKGIEDALLNIVNVDVTVVKQKVIQKALDELQYINSNETNEDGDRKSTFTCTELSKMKTDDEVVKFIIEKHSEKGIVEELERIKSELGGTGTDTYKESKKMLYQYFNKLISSSTEVRELKKAIGVVRTQCEEAAKQQEEIDKIDNQEFEITIVGGVL